MERLKNHTGPGVSNQKAEYAALQVAKPGRLFYVMGPSGAGKDTLLGYARERLTQAPVIFAHRYITRPVEIAGENHIHLSEAEFTNRLQRGCFKFHWHSHGWDYGLGIEVDSWLQIGLNVVMNGSRGYFEQARLLHPTLVPVVITASEAILRERLQRRGRESGSEIEERIARAKAFERLDMANGCKIDNSSTIQAAGERFVALLSGVGSNV
ncbi:MAG: phosphonate metabolism protein/1,5-bisphosphokinase (PRPP-forming) PhnN [Gammaproteobacteria bacterium]|nr:phosphonate metabolism protein/1,5-bisphosphokinase (PRPP-forming) PhnN [Gammaproteobacteria bacterium]MBD3776095.1 phosphonate metabolism protein/1,5-bisphosphokinase (PRPP-forming) PhnN [Thiotrichales bacterium]